MEAVAASWHVRRFHDPIRAHLTALGLQYERRAFVDGHDTRVLEEGDVRGQGSRELLDIGRRVDFELVLEAVDPFDGKRHRLFSDVHETEAGAGCRRNFLFELPRLLVGFGVVHEWDAAHGARELLAADEVLHRAHRARRSGRDELRRVGAEVGLDPCVPRVHHGRELARRERSRAPADPTRVDDGDAQTGHRELVRGGDSRDSRSHDDDIEGSANADGGKAGNSLAGSGESGAT